MSGNSVKKVLIVDDEPDVVTYLTMVLEDQGYETLGAGNAEDALAAARRAGADLICLDIMMPKRSGLSLYRQIKQDPSLRAIPALFVSAFSKAQDFTRSRFRALISDQDIPLPEGFIEKPIEIDEFIQAVQAIIGPGRGDVS